MDAATVRASSSNAQDIPARRQHALLTPLPATELIAWKEAGLSEPVIQAAMNQVQQP